MNSRQQRAVFVPDRTDALHKLLRSAPRERRVAPAGQPFAFTTQRGEVRKDNQDTALVLAGRRGPVSQTFLAAVVCDGMGGLELGDEAADLAAASAGAILARGEPLVPNERMDRAIRGANRAVFERFRGRAGAVLVAVLVEEGQTVIGWVGDARAYGLQDGVPRLLTHDDTVAGEIERIEGPAPDAMDALLRAIGPKAEVEPHVESVEPGVQALLLLSDGVHRMEPTMLNWIARCARRSEDLVDRLAIAASWDGRDNATALVLELGKEPALDVDSLFVAAWVESQPRIWEIVPVERSVKPRSTSQAPAAPVARREQPSAATATGRQVAGVQKSRSWVQDAQPEQIPLQIELGKGPGEK